MVGGQEQADLAAEAGAGCLIVEEIGNPGNKVGAVEVLYDRKDIDAGAFRF